MSERPLSPRRVWIWLARLVSCYLLFTATGIAEERGPPQRIVSLNLCLDSVLVELVPRQHILALSQYARDPLRLIKPSLP